MQVAHVTDQNTNMVGLSVKMPENLNFWPLMFDNSTPSREETVPGSLSGINNEIKGNVRIAINKSIA